MAPRFGRLRVGGTYDNKDLIWIGNAVNRSTRISDECKSPYHIGISKAVYDNLEESLLHIEKKNQWGYLYKEEVWSSAWLNYNDSFETMYKTSCWIEFI